MVLSNEAFNLQALPLKAHPKARLLRIEFAGAVYHLTSRGNRQEDIFLDDADRNHFLSILGQVCECFNWVVHAYCLMDNHYHLLIENPG